MVFSAFLASSSASSLGSDSLRECTYLSFFRVLSVVLGFIAGIRFILIAWLQRHFRGGRGGRRLTRGLTRRSLLGTVANDGGERRVNSESINRIPNYQTYCKMHRLRGRHTPSFRTFREIAPFFILFERVVVVVVFGVAADDVIDFNPARFGRRRRGVVASFVVLVVVVAVAVLVFVADRLRRSTSSAGRTADAVLNQDSEG